MKDESKWTRGGPREWGPNRTTIGKSEIQELHKVLCRHRLSFSPRNNTEPRIHAGLAIKR